MGEWYPTILERRQMNLERKNRKIERQLKDLKGFQTVMERRAKINSNRPETHQARRQNLALYQGMDYSELMEMYQ